jgi:hypothetical protein
VKTLWIEFTGWRRPRCERTLFGSIFRFAFFGIGVSRDNLTEWVATWHSKLNQAMRGQSK